MLLSVCDHDIQQAWVIDDFNIAIAHAYQIDKSEGKTGKPVNKLYDAHLLTVTWNLQTLRNPIKVKVNSIENFNGWT